MLNQEEIKNYNGREDIEKDYENFRSDWEYDPEQRRGVHKSGLVLTHVSFGFDEKIKYDRLPEWTADAISSGLSEAEAKQYLRMLNNQFVILNEKEPYVEPEKTLEEHLKEWEEIDKRNLERAREYNHLSEEQLQEMAERQKKYREWYIYESGYYGKGSDK